MKPQIVNTRNRMLSQNIYMTLDTKKTDRNNNILIAGGSGCGKSFKFAKPNILQMFGSYIITDPKGESCRDTAGFLHENGYNVKVLNLIQFAKSSRYNPFKYIRNDTDVIKLIGQLISNTTPKGASAGDPFWEKAEGLFLQSLFQYVWREGVEDDNGVVQHNIGAVLQLLQEAEFKEDARGMKLDSKLDKRMSALEKRDKKHPAVIQYNKVMRGAADTVRSIIISANSRLAPIQSPEIIELLSEDEFDIPSIGTQKTVVYCIIPDSDKTYNFLVGLFYSQTFNQLYYTADFVYDGPLPIHVTFLLDEFANVALPDDFCSLLSTMRSRNISSIIIIQNFGQLNALFKDNKDNIEGNCDTFIFLGGNESSTHEKVSKSVGKQTIYKKSTSISRGKNGSTSSSEDVLGREIMMPDEVRKLRRDECIVLINGFDAVLDKKIRIWEHPLYNQMVKASKRYAFDARIDRANRKKAAIVDKDSSSVNFLDNSFLEHLIAMDNQAMKEYETEKYVADISGEEEPEKPRQNVIQIEFSQLMAMDLDSFSDSEDEFKQEFIDYVNKDQVAKNDEVEANNQEQLKEKYHRENINIKEELKTPEQGKVYMLLKKEGFTAEQIRLILPLAETYSEDKIISYFSNDMSNEDIEDCVNLLQL